jgi:hypothetical protein
MSLIKLRQGVYVDPETIISINTVEPHESYPHYSVIVQTKNSQAFRVACANDVDARYKADEIAEQVFTSATLQSKTQESS